LIRRAALASCALALAAVGCEQRVEVLTLEGDAGVDAAVECGTCDEDAECVDGRCLSLPDVSAVAGGDDHTCLISAGVMYCTGSNMNGQLGMNDTQLRNTPARLRWAEQWFSVAAGAHHTCGLRGQDNRGTLHCWGKNDVGQLGFPSGGQRMRGSLNRVGDFTDWTQLECGGDNCCALRDNGALYCWGANADGSAGQGSGSVVSNPARVGGDSTFSRFSVGGGHSCAVRSDKALLCWGKNTSGQLGIGSSRDAQRTPVEVKGGRQDWLRVAAGAAHTCGIRGDQELSCWGSNDMAQLGSEMLGPDGEPIALIDLPGAVAFEKDWLRIAAGGFHTCALRRSREAYCWGNGNLGQLGNGASKLQAAPTKVAGGHKWRELGLGQSHSCGLSGAPDERSYYCWGDSDSGKLGIGDSTQRDTPVSLAQP